MNWSDWQSQWREAQVSILNLPADDPQEAALIQSIQTQMAELYNLRADHSEDAPAAAARPEMHAGEGGR